MNCTEKTENLLIKHYQTYPEMQLQDLFKLLHQSAFGCEHLVSSLNSATEYIRREYENIPPEADADITELDGSYCRVPLSLLNKGLKAETLGKLFFTSAKKEPDGKTELIRKLDVARELIYKKLLPFSDIEFDEAVSKWSAEGYPAVRHSDIFRQKYHPAYRVISKDYVPFLPLFTELDNRLEKGALKLCLEGGSASGKSTLASILEKLYDCTVFHMDDFFLRPEQRTPERFAEIGGNIDRERFLSEVIEPLKKGETVCYRKFDCSTMSLCEPVTVSPEKLTVIEGAYSMHPEFSDCYDLSVFISISPELQKERILKRNSPPLAKRFFEEWIPLETKYFTSWDIPGKCDMIIRIDIY